MTKRLVVIILLISLTVPSLALTAQDSAPNKQAVLTEIKQDLDKADRSLQTNQFDPALKEYQAALDLVKRYKDNAAFAAAADATQIKTYHFRALGGLGIATFRKVMPQDDFRDNVVNIRTDEVYYADNNRVLAAAPFLEEALEVAKALPDDLAGKERVYMVLGWTYRLAYGFSHPISAGLKAEAAFKNAAELFRRRNNQPMLMRALYERAQAIFFLPEAEQSGGVSAAEWIKIGLDSIRESFRLSDTLNLGEFRGRAGDAYCGIVVTLSQDLELGIRLGSPDALQGIDLDALLREQVSVATKIMNDFPTPYWCRGTANARLAWRTGNVALAWSAIADLKTAVSYPIMEKEGFMYLLYPQYYLGRAYWQVGRPDQALVYLQAAEKSAQRRVSIGLERLPWPLWTNTRFQYEDFLLQGRSLTTLGRYADAEQLLSRTAKVKEDEALYPDIQSGLAELYQKQGRYDTALEALNKRRAYYEKLLKATSDAAKAKPYKIALVDTLMRSSVPLLVLGRTEDALTAMQQALDQVKAIDNPALLVDTTLQIGDIYLQLGDEANAITQYTQAAELAQKANLPQKRGRALLGLGRIQAARGMVKEATATLTQAGQAAQSAQDIEGQVYALVAQGDLALKGSKPDTAAAERLYRQANDLALKGGNARLNTAALLALGDLRAQGSDPMAAALTYHEGLAYAESINDLETIIQLQGRLGQQWAKRARPELADRAYATAIDLIERTQRGFQSESLKSQFAANYAWVYANYITVLFNQQRFEDAFRVAERARARAFLDQLAIGPMDLRQGASAELLQKETSLRQNVEALQQVLGEALRTVPLDRDRVTKLQSDLQAAQNEYSVLLARMQAENPRLATLVGVEVAPLAKLQGALDAQTTLISYYTTDDQTYAFILTANKFTAVPLNVKRADLVEAVARFRADTKQAAGLDVLSKQVIEPLHGKLKTSRLVIVPHGILHYLPFATLPAGDKGTLGEQYAISYLPSATTLLYLPAKPTQSGKLLALGNPAAAGQRPLPFAEAEVKQVVAITGGEAFSGQAATEGLLIKRANQAGVLYLAAHGTFNPRNPLFSALHLAAGDGEDGQFNAYEIYRLNLTQATELVVLSACETGVGTLSAGDEFTGLNRAFLYAGAPSVLASLWRVDDKATGLLMKAFFEARAKGMGNAEALQAAQAYLRSYEEGGQKPYASPYFWAAFILTGRS